MLDPVVIKAPGARFNRSTTTKKTKEEKMEKEKMLKKIGILLLAACMCFALFGCGGSGDSAEDDSTESSSDSGQAEEENGGGLDHVTFVSPVALDSFDLMATYAAKHLGYFEEEGIDVEFVEQLGTDDVKMVAAGTAQFSYPSPGVFMSSIDAGIENVKAVANYCSIQIFGIASNKDANIKSWDDLKGKDVALGSESWTPLFTPILHAAGVSPDDVNMVSFGTGRYEACASGQTPALGTWLNEYYQLLGQGYDFDYLDGNTVAPQISNALCTSLDIIENNPDLVRRYIRAFAKGTYFLYLNPEAAADITLLTRPNLVIDWEGAVGAAKGTVMMQFGTDEAEQKERLDAGIGLFDFEYCQNAADNLLAAGAISNPIDASKYYTNEFVDTGWDKAPIEADAAAYSFSSAVYVDAH
jgi:ABC-type nitrate/sulfonate/bicarbonate transport system substrate-binding protein